MGMHDGASSLQFALVSVYLQEYASMVSYRTAMMVFYLTCKSSWAN